MSFGATGRNYVYFPKQPMLTRVTKFNSIIVDKPDIYNTYMDKVVITIDGLECLRNVFAEVLDQARDTVYSMVSGDCTQEVFTALLRTYYRRCAAFTNYVDDVMMDNPENLTRAIIKPLRDRIEEFLSEQDLLAQNSGGKYLMRSNDKLYFAYVGRTFENVKGVTVIND